MGSGEGAPKLRLRTVEAFERAVPLRLPFRFGAVTLRAVRQAFVRVAIQVEGGGEAFGWAAELMVPKWFDKDPARSNDDNVDQLRRSISAAARFHLTRGETHTAWGHARSFVGARRLGEAETDPNGLVAGFGASLLDRAVIDALCRVLERPFPDAVAANLLGIDFRDALGLPEGFEARRFLRGLRLPESLEVRHTVGLADALRDAERSEPVDDGLPESLEAAVARYGHRCFKLKLSGRPPEDLERLRAIARVLDGLAEYRVTLDGNEQFESVEAVAELATAIEAEPALARLRAGLLYLEQPLPRRIALDRDVGPLDGFAPVVLDESDDEDDVFVHARARGYRGISSKACKGVYRALLNAARCRAWNAELGEERWFMAAEDLTTQPGLAVQQDLVLAGLVGCSHVERNGHHYVSGMAGAAPAEQAAFESAHPDLYRREGGALRLRIDSGRVRLGSLLVPGFASGALPEVEALEAMEL